MSILDDWEPEGFTDEDIEAEIDSRTRKDRKTTLRTRSWRA